MFEDSVSSIPSIWASMNSWFTPAILFVLLNVMIGTIAIASNLGGGAAAKHQDNHEQQQQQQQNYQQQQGLVRSPSMLQRLKSINLYSYRSPEPHATATATAYEKSPEFTEHTHYATRYTHESEQPQFVRSPSLLQRLKSINFYTPQDYSTPPPSSAVTAAPEITEDTHYASIYTHETEQPQFSRSPSLLQRLKSLNFHIPPYIPQDYSTPPPSTAAAAAAAAKTQFDHDQFQAHDYLEDHEDPDENSDEEAEEQSLDEVFSQLKPLSEHHVNRTMSDTKPAAGEIPTKLPKKMKKSASSKSAFAHFQEEEIVETRRPATVKEKKAAKMAAEDEEVDAKADDFINRFKNQLKLQRLDSIIRYKDMINRGSSDK